MQNARGKSLCLCLIRYFDHGRIFQEDQWHQGEGEHSAGLAAVLPTGAPPTATLTTLASPATCHGRCGGVRARVDEDENENVSRPLPRS